MEPPPPSPLARGFVIVFIVGIITFFLLRTPGGPLDTEETTPTVEVDAGVPILPPRCVAHGADTGVVVGKSIAGEEKRFVPFAAEIGRGVALAEGFSLGVKHPIEGVTHAAVAHLDARAETIELTALGKARGDVDAPVVVAHGSGWVAAMLEPNASGMSLRLVRPEGDGLAWGAEIAQGRDESLAYDLTFGEKVGVVAWDDVTEDNQRGLVMLATVASESLEGGESAQAVSSEDVDAELPRVIRRPNGFWLAYIARSRGGVEGDAGVEGQYRGERIVSSWIELVPLDEHGRPDGQPRAVTSRDGFALAFDMEPTADGGALLAWRDDDTPSGAHGGRVTSQLVTVSGAGQEQTIAEDDVGAGVPTLLPTWISIPNRSADVLLAPTAQDGQVTGDLRVEPLLREGQLVAASKDVLLVAQPASGAIRLITVRCTR